MIVAISSTSESESAAITYPAPCHLRVQRIHKSLLDRMPVAQRQHARHVFLADAGIYEDRPLAGMQKLANTGGVLDPRNRARVLEAAGQRHGHQIDARSGVAPVAGWLGGMGGIPHAEGG